MAKHISRVRNPRRDGVPGRRPPLPPGVPVTPDQHAAAKDAAAELAGDTAETPEQRRLARASARRARKTSAAAAATATASAPADPAPRRIGGVEVIAAERALAGIATRDGKPVTYARIEKVLLADGRELYACVDPAAPDCEFTAPAAPTVASHLRVHKTWTVEEADTLLERWLAGRADRLPNPFTASDAHRMGASRARYPGVPDLTAALDRLVEDGRLLAAAVPARSAGVPGASPTASRYRHPTQTAPQEDSVPAPAPAPVRLAAVPTPPPAAPSTAPSTAAKVEIVPAAKPAPAADKAPAELGLAELALELSRRVAGLAELERDAADAKDWRERALRAERRADAAETAARQTRAQLDTVRAKLSELGMELRIG